MSAPGFRQFDTLAVVGLGLIGGSFAMEVRRLGLAKRILGMTTIQNIRQKSAAEI